MLPDVAPPSQSFEQAIFQAKAKLNRACRHASEVQDLLNHYMDNQGCEILKEVDLETGRIEFRAVGGPVPQALPCGIGDTFQNLNSALDYIASGIMREATGRSARTHFPMNQTRDALKRSFAKAGGGRKAGGYRKVVEACPRFAMLILCKIRPYKAGGRFIWEVRQLANTDKHRLMVPAIYVTSLTNALIVDDNGNELTIPLLEMEPGGIIRLLSTDSADGRVLRYGQASLSVTFPADAEAFAGEPLIPTLEKCVREVREVISMCDEILSPLFQVSS